MSGPLTHQKKQPKSGKRQLKQQRERQDARRQRNSERQQAALLNAPAPQAPPPVPVQLPDARFEDSRYAAPERAPVNLLPRDRARLESMLVSTGRANDPAGGVTGIGGSPNPETEARAEASAATVLHMVESGTHRAQDAEAKWKSRKEAQAAATKKAEDDAKKYAKQKEPKGPAPAPAPPADLSAVDPYNRPEEITTAHLAHGVSAHGPGTDQYGRLVHGRRADEAAAEVKAGTAPADSIELTRPAGDGTPDRLVVPNYTTVGSTPSNNAGAFDDHRQMLGMVNEAFARANTSALPATGAEEAGEDGSARAPEEIIADISSPTKLGTSLTVDGIDSQGKSTAKSAQGLAPDEMQARFEAIKTQDAYSARAVMRPVTVKGRAAGWTMQTIYPVATSEGKSEGRSEKVTAHYNPMTGTVANERPAKPTNQLKGVDEEGDALTAHHIYPWNQLREQLNQALTGKDRAKLESMLRFADIELAEKLPAGKDEAWFWKELAKEPPQRGFRFSEAINRIVPWICWAPRNIFMGPSGSKRADDPGEKLDATLTASGLPSPSSALGELVDRNGFGDAKTAPADPAERGPDRVDAARWTAFADAVANQDRDAVERMLVAEGVNLEAATSAYGGAEWFWQQLALPEAQQAPAFAQLLHRFSASIAWQRGDRTAQTAKRPDQASRQRLGDILSTNRRETETGPRTYRPDDWEPAADGKKKRRRGLAQPKPADAGKAKGGKGKAAAAKPDGEPVKTERRGAEEKVRAAVGYGALTDEQLGAFMKEVSDIRAEVAGKADDTRLRKFDTDLLTKVRQLTVTHAAAANRRPAKASPGAKSQDPAVRAKDRLFRDLRNGLRGLAERAKR